jgi:hypothetical protein
MAADESTGTCLGCLSSREVCQILREVVSERRTMTKIGSQTWDEVYACHFPAAMSPKPTKERIINGYTVD